MGYCYCYCYCYSYSYSYYFLFIFFFLNVFDVIRLVLMLLVPKMEEGKEKKEKPLK